MSGSLATQWKMAWECLNLTHTQHWCCPARGPQVSGVSNAFLGLSKSSVLHGIQKASFKTAAGDICTSWSLEVCLLIGPFYARQDNQPA